MIDEKAVVKENKLLREFKDLLLQSVLRSFKPKGGTDKDSRARKSVSRQLAGFVDEDGNAKEWIRARCLESVVASAGLDEYLGKLVDYRGSSASRITPLNIMFASSQIARALDPIIVRLLEELWSRKRLEFSRWKFDALISILNPRLDFTVPTTEVNFDVHEVERLRNLLLEMALDIFGSRSSQLRPRSVHKFSQLKSLGKAPDFSLEKLIETSKKYTSLDVSLKAGVLRWQYGSEPSIYVKDGACFYDQMEISSKGTGYNSVKKQLDLMKKAMLKRAEKE